MVNDERPTDETNRYDEIDTEIDLDDIPEDRSNTWRYLKNILFVLLLAVIGLTVIWASFKGGQKLFLVYKTTVKDSLQEEVVNKSKMPGVAIAPKADGTLEGEVKGGVKESDPEKIVEAASGLNEKIDNPLIEKNIVQPAKMDVAPVPKAERSDAAAKPEMTIPDVKQAAISPTVKPETRVSKPVAKKKTTAPKVAKKHKRYKVIVGSFSIKANADSLASRLIVNHYKPRIVLAKTPKGRLYRVVAGSYRSLGETKAKMGELKELGIQSFLIAE